jgi:subtilisin family serine protease
MSAHTGAGARIRLLIAAGLAAGLLAAPFAALSPLAPGAMAKQRQQVVAQPRDDGRSDDDDGDDLEDGDRAESCEIERTSDEFCAGEVIVAMESGVPVSAVVQEMASEQITLTQSGVIAGANIYLFSYAVTDDDSLEPQDLIEELKDIEFGDDRPAVRWAELNYVGNAPQGNPSRFFPRDAGAPQASTTGTSWGKAKTASPRAATCADGRGSLVAVIDTGIDRTHPAFRGRIRGGWNAFDGTALIDDAGNGLNDDGDTQYGTTTPLIDEAVGHGTHVAGIVLQAAPRANLLPIKALDSDGAGQAFYLARAIHHAIDAGAGVINLSLGSTGNSRAVSEAVQRALSAGIVVVAAAGNDGATGRPEYPAAQPGVIAVGATSRTDRAASFNTTRSGIDLGAPGVGIASAFPAGQQGITTRYATWTGSSMAAPWVSGAAAALGSQYADWSPARIANRLGATADPVKGGSLGAGRVDIGAAAACTKTR